MKQSPCMNCTRQHKRVGCHSGCEDYKVYRAALDVIHNAKIAETERLRSMAGSGTCAA